MTIQEKIKNNSAGLLSGVSYNVPGIFLCSKLIYLFMDMVAEKLEYELPIKYLYGAPQVKWNGGRLIVKNYNKSSSLEEVEREFSEARKRQIKPLVTFSNTLIQEKDLFDEECNEILKILSAYSGGVIVSSDLLTEYIKEIYPNVNIHASVIKTCYPKIRDVDYYTMLSQMYDYYVVHPDDNFDKELLSKLKKKNAEIMVNERCYFKCPLRKEHYDCVSQEQLDKIHSCYKDFYFLNKCKAIPEEKQIFSKERNIALTVSEVKELYDLDYRLFKIQGRTDNLYLLFFDIMRYTLENDFAFPTIYSIFSNKINSFIRGEI